MVIEGILEIYNFMDVPLASKAREREITEDLIEGIVDPAESKSKPKVKYGTYPFLQCLNDGVYG